MSYVELKVFHPSDFLCLMKALFKYLAFVIGRVCGTIHRKYHLIEGGLQNKNGLFLELHFLFLFYHQKQRFLSNNWEKADALDMMNVYNGLPFEDRTRFCVLCSLIKVNNHPREEG